MPALCRKTTVRSVIEPTGTGTRSAAPVRRPSSSGMTLPIAFAAPDDVGVVGTGAARARGGAGGGREGRGGGRAGPAQVGVRAVVQPLVARLRVDRHNQAGLYAERVVENPRQP